MLVLGRVTEFWKRPDHFYQSDQMRFAFVFLLLSFLKHFERQCCKCACLKFRDAPERSKFHRGAKAQSDGSQGNKETADPESQDEGVPG